MPETWVLMMMLVSGDTKVPLSVPNIATHEECMEQGKYAQAIAEKLSDVQIAWNCAPGTQTQPQQQPQGEDEFVPEADPNQAY